MLCKAGETLTTMVPHTLTWYVRALTAPTLRRMACGAGKPHVSLATGGRVLRGAESTHVDQVHGCTAAQVP
jgi:hypothetical protein